MISQDQDNNTVNDTNSQSIFQRKIFVGGLPQSISEQEFRDYFGKFGSITEASLVKERSTDKHRGFGFVTYDSQDVAIQVKSQKHALKGQDITVNDALKKQKKFFVGGIARDRTDTDTMRKYFEQFGHITDIFVIKERGFGFVTLEEDETAENLKPLLDQVWHNIDGKNCEVRLARPKEMNTGPRGRGGYRGGGRGRGMGGGYGMYGGGYYENGGYGGYPSWGGYGGGRGSGYGFSGGRGSSSQYGGNAYDPSHAGYSGGNYSRNSGYGSSYGGRGGQSQSGYGRRNSYGGSRGSSGRGGYSGSYHPY